jgi:hypothetical protein
MIRVFFIGDDGHLTSRLLTPAEAEAAVRRHLTFARLKAAA